MGALLGLGDSLADSRLSAAGTWRCQKLRDLRVSTWSAAGVDKNLALAGVKDDLLKVWPCSSPRNPSCTCSKVCRSDGFH
jgi:hypothetical protein